MSRWSLQKPLPRGGRYGYPRPLPRPLHGWKGGLSRGEYRGGGLVGDWSFFVESTLLSFTWTPVSVTICLLAVHRCCRLPPFAFVDVDAGGFVILELAEEFWGLDWSSVCFVVV